MPNLAAVAADLLTPREVAERFKICLGSQAAMRHRGQIPFIRLGGGRLIRYQRAAIEAWIAERAVGVRK